MLKIRRALMSVSDKTGIPELALALHESGTEIVATGKTAELILKAGIPVTPIENVTGNPESFGGRMKTLSFQVCSGILYRRSHMKDLEDAQKLNIAPIDCVVVNFYPFEKTLAQLRSRGEINREELIEQIDIGGPTLVRAAAKNSPDVLVLTDPSQYEGVQKAIRKGGVPSDLVDRCASDAWSMVAGYDRAIANELGTIDGDHSGRIALKYGENPHQSGWMECQASSPIDWTHPALGTALSYNNALDLSAAYGLATELKLENPDYTGVVIVKHNNPCGVALVAKAQMNAQLNALKRAWEGDPISAFGGVVVFTDTIEMETATWLSDHFIEVLAAPGPLAASDPLMNVLAKKRKNLRAVTILRFERSLDPQVVSIAGAKLIQDCDTGPDPEFNSVAGQEWDRSRQRLAQFGIHICRTLKSNSLAIVREGPGPDLGYQLVGTGQGQPNRVEALKRLAIPRAEAVLKATGGRISECVLVSDAFFPFKDTVEEAHRGGLQWIVQPGGSIRDQESIDACKALGVNMVFTGRRHFRH